jgi:hypothetical protein
MTAPPCRGSYTPLPGVIASQEEPPQRNPPYQMLNLCGRAREKSARLLCMLDRLLPAPMQLCGSSPHPLRKTKVGCLKPEWPRPTRLRPDRTRKRARYPCHCNPPLAPLARPPNGPSQRQTPREHSVRLCEPLLTAGWLPPIALLPPIPPLAPPSPR